MAGTIEGYVTVFEFTTAGALWQVFIDGTPLTTTDENAAETLRLAIATSSRVRVSYDDVRAITQVRIQFCYRCESHAFTSCDGAPRTACETHRVSPCRDGQVPQCEPLG